MTPLERAARAAQEADGAYRHESGQWMKEGGLVSDSHWKDIARAVLTAIREPEADTVAAMLACALADSAAPNGYADVSGADQALAAKMSAWMAERGWVLVKYPRDLMTDAALADGA